MLNIKSNHKLRISNRMAAFAALMLLVSGLAGFGNSGLTAKDSADQLADSASAQFFAGETPGGNTHITNKSFKVSLFLFRFD